MNVKPYHKKKSDKEYNTVLGQLLEQVRRPEFEKLIEAQGSDKFCKIFNTWGHFATMLFAQVSGQHGVRSIGNALNQQKGAFYQLGIKSESIKRSTLSYANNHHSSGFFEVLFYQLVQKIQFEEKSFPFANALFAIDATTVDLCMKLFEWARFCICQFLPPHYGKVTSNPRKRSMRRLFFLGYIHESCGESGVIVTFHGSRLCQSDSDLHKGAD